MSQKEPWEEKWRTLEPLDKKSGQGITYLVEELADGQRRGVAKKLKNNKDAQQRRRMHGEVTNLDILANAGVKVPHVWDGNTLTYNEGSAQLYFVMEFIPGQTLREVVGERGRIPLADAARIVFDLCSTVKAAHQNKVLHRDLKPENIVVRSFDPVDAVVVDFGLSFNNSEEEGATRTGDTFRNKFLDLPETNTPTGDLRDRRSDITALCGLLYYCLTGHVPGQLRDEKGLPPHRRPGCALRDALASDERCQQLDLLLDRGFTVEIGGRFQTVDELEERLRSALLPPSGRLEDPVTVALRFHNRLLQQDRASQLTHYKTTAQQLLQDVMAHWTGFNGRLGNMLQISHSFTGTTGTGDMPTGHDLVELGVILSVTITSQQLTRMVQFAVGSKGTQCELLCRFSNKPKQAAHRQIAGQPVRAVGEFGPWEELLWYDPSKKPEKSAWSPRAEDMLSKVLNDMEAEVFST